MNETLRRTWPSVLVAVLALCYAWIGVVAQGWGRLFGLVGAVLILAGITAARRSVPIAGTSLLAGALPLAILTWWSIATPILAILVVLLGWTAIRHLSEARRAGPVSVL
jgi:hypothetical protein